MTDAAGNEAPRRPAGATHERLLPGEHCRVSEAQWSQALEQAEPLHQWGSAFLVEREGSVWAWVRDDSGGQRHTVFRLDAARSARARQGVIEVEQLARRAADAVTEEQQRGASSLPQRAALESVGQAFVDAAEALYRELLARG